MEEIRLKPKSDANVDRVNRGGGWNDDPQFARVAYRDSYDPAYRYDDLGFRLVHDHNHQGERDEKEV